MITVEVHPPECREEIRDLSPSANDTKFKDDVEECRRVAVSNHFSESLKFSENM